MILCDTGGLVANYDRSDRQHTAVHRILTRPDRRILSPFVLAELDYLVARIAGQDAELLTLDDVARGVYEIAVFTTDDVARAKAIIERYRALELGLTDASIVVLAERYQCYDVLTLDQQHFRTVSAPNGRPFRLLPMDVG